MAITFVGTRMPDSGSLAGDTLVLRQMETGDTAFTVTAASVSVSGPSGTSSPSVTSPPSGSSISHVLQALLTEALGGQYNVVWHMEADGQTILRPQRLFATWTDVRDRARRLLLATDVVVTNQDIDTTLFYLMPEVFNNAIVPDISYSTLPDVDKDKVDLALGLLIAAWMRPFVPRQSPTGQVIRFTSGTDTYQWKSDQLPVNGRSIEEQWIDQAWSLLQATVSFGSALDALQSHNVGFQAKGRRRGRPSAYIVDIFGTRLNPAFQMWQGWLGGIGASVDWSWGKL